MPKSALVRHAPAAVLGLLTVVAGLAFAVPLTWPGGWAAGQPRLAAVSEARASRAATATPVDLPQVRAQTLAVLAERPLDSVAWARLAWIAAEEDDIDAARDALDRSYVAAPYWAERLVKMRQIDTHIFYRWTGGWGLPAAFSGVHAGVEPIIAKLAAIATFVEDLTVPVIEDDLSSDLSIAPMVDLAPAVVVASAEDDASGSTELAAPPPVEVVAAPPPPPPVLASPLDAGRGVTPQRRARIAVPR